MGTKVTPEKIQWGSYGGTSGPMHLGLLRYELPKTADVQDRCLYVVTSTEGATYDAVNMYDQCIVSLGLIQWAGASVDRLLGQIVDSCGYSVIDSALGETFHEYGVGFVKHGDGKWGFIESETGKAIVTKQDRQRVFWGCDGVSWTPDAKKRAKSWAAAFANVWLDPGARQIQVQWTKPKLKDFLLPQVEKVLFDGSQGPDRDAFRAACMSYAANNPAKLGEMFAAGLKRAESAELAKWSHDWICSILKSIVVESTWKIWPARWTKVQPACKIAFGIELPLFELIKEWNPPAKEEEKKSPDPVKETVVEIPVTVEPPPPTEVIVTPEPVQSQGWVTRLLKWIASLFSK